MELTLNVSPKFIKKVKALRALTDTDNMDEVIVELLERAADQAIIDALASLDEEPVVRQAPKPKPARRLPEDVTHLSEGLGDQMDDEEANAQGAATEEDLDHDMDLDDPDTEAAADASELAIFGESPESIFAEAAGLPVPPADSPKANERARRRQAIKKSVLPPRKGRVSGFESHEESSF